MLADYKNTQNNWITFVLILYFYMVDSNFKIKCKYVCKFKKNSSLDVLNPNFFVLHLFYVAFTSRLPPGKRHAISGQTPCYCSLIPMRLVLILLAIANCSRCVSFFLLLKNIYIDDDDFCTHVRRRIISIISIISI